MADAPAYGWNLPAEKREFILMFVGFSFCLFVCLFVDVDVASSSPTHLFSFFLSFVFSH